MAVPREASVCLVAVHDDLEGAARVDYLGLLGHGGLLELLAVEFLEGGHAEQEERKELAGGKTRGSKIWKNPTNKQTRNFFWSRECLPFGDFLFGVFGKAAGSSVLRTGAMSAKKRGKLVGAHNFAEVLLVVSTKDVNFALSALVEPGLADGP